MTEHEENLFKDFVEKIRSDLVPLYPENLVVQRFEDLEARIHPYFYIAKLIPTKILWVFKSTKKQKIFAIYIGFYGGADGWKEIRIALIDDRAKITVKKHIEKFVKDNNITRVDDEYGEIVILPDKKEEDGR